MFEEKLEVRQLQGSRWYLKTYSVSWCWTPRPSVCQAPAMRHETSWTAVNILICDHTHNSYLGWWLAGFGCGLGCRCCWRRRGCLLLLLSLLFLRFLGCNLLFLLFLFLIIVVNFLLSLWTWRHLKPKVQSVQQANIFSRWRFWSGGSGFLYTAPHVGGRAGDLRDDLVTHERGDGVDTFAGTTVSRGRLGDGAKEAWQR